MHEQCYVYNGHGYVYLVHCPETGLYKIGKTEHPRQRLDQLRAESAYPIDFCVLMECDREVMNYFERSLHEQFKHCRTHGEWFKLSATEVHWFNVRRVRLIASLTVVETVLQIDEVDYDPEDGSLMCSIKEGYHFPHK